MLAMAVFIFLFVLSPPGLAVEYFFDSSAGKDTNTGFTESIPFKSLQKLAEFQLQPGDSVWLKRGCSFRGQMTFRGNGEQDKPIRFGAYGVGPMPEILGSIELREWEPYKTIAFKCRLPQEIVTGTDVYGVYLYDNDTVPRRLLREPDRIPDAPGYFHYDKAAGILYITTPDGSIPATHRIEVSVTDELMLLDRRAWIDIDGLSLLFGNRRHIVIKDSQHIVVRNCASLFVGSYGNPNIYLIRSTDVEINGCFLYENANCGIFITDQSTRCRVTACTIVKCSSNDGVTLHSGGRDKNGVREGLTGNFNTVENNVIGLCPEEAIDITSGDGHLIQGNICYSNGNPGIIVGHDSDHILIRNNISFANARAGIHISGNKEEGSRGNNCVMGNLIYRNGYPGLELDSPNCLVANNTVVDSMARAAVRINKNAIGTRLLNNIVATTTPEISGPSVQFLLGTPAAFGVALENNLYFHVGRPDGRIIQTLDGDLTLAEMKMKYGACQTDVVADPRFQFGPDRYFIPKEMNPGKISNISAPKRQAAGSGQVSGWKVPDDNSRPNYPAAIITGKNDDAVVLWLWGKGPVPDRRGDEEFLSPDLKSAAAAALTAIADCESKGDLVSAWKWYQTALYNMLEDDPKSIELRIRMSALLNQTQVSLGIRRQFAESNIARAQELIEAPKKKWDMIAHYLQVAVSGLKESDPARVDILRIIQEHKDELSSYMQ